MNLNELSCRKKIEGTYISGLFLKSFQRLHDMGDSFFINTQAFLSCIEYYYFYYYSRVISNHQHHSGLLHAQGQLRNVSWKFAKMAYHYKCTYLKHNDRKHWGKLAVTFGQVTKRIKSRVDRHSIDILYEAQPTFHEGSSIRDHLSPRQTSKELLFPLWWLPSFPSP